MEPTVNTVIDNTKCIGCGLCVRVCLSETLSLKDGKAVVSPCTGTVMAAVDGLVAQVSQLDGHQIF